jgi:hypothetical protein
MRGAILLATTVIGEAPHLALIDMEKSATVSGANSTVLPGRP